MDKYVKHHSPLKYYYFFLFLGSAFFVAKYSYAFVVLILLGVMTFSYYLVLSHHNKNFIWGAFYKNLAISVFLSFLYVVILVTVSVKLTVFPTLLFNTLQVFGIRNTNYIIDATFSFVLCISPKNDT